MWMSYRQPKEGPEEEHVLIARCWYWYCVSFTGLYPLMLLNENKKALAAEDQSQEPKMLITMDQGPATKSCFLFAAFTFKVELCIVLKFKR